MGAQNLGVAMKMLGFKVWHSALIYLETVKYLFLMRFRIYRQYMPEIITWLLFAACLVTLSFVIGLSAGLILGQTPMYITNKTCNIEFLGD